MPSAYSNKKHKFNYHSWKSKKGNNITKTRILVILWLPVTLKT